MGGEQVLIFSHLADICCHLALHIFFAVDTRQHGIMFNAVPEGLSRHLLRTLAGKQPVSYTHLDVYKRQAI